MASIPERARDLRHAIADLVVEHGWSGYVDSVVDDLLRDAIEQSQIVYLVTGLSGSRNNEDFATWTVIAYGSEDLAKEHVRRAQRRANHLRWACRAWQSCRTWEFPGRSKYLAVYGEPMAESNPYDPYMEWSHDGVEYQVETLLLSQKLSIWKKGEENTR